MNGHDLFETRKLLELTQAGMAQAMGVSLRSYHRYESSLGPLPTKVERLVAAVRGQAAALKGGDKRFKAPVDWLKERGKAVYVYETTGAEIGSLPWLLNRKGDPHAHRYRYPTLAAALADPMFARPIAQSSETDTEIHIYLA